MVKPWSAWYINITNRFAFHFVIQSTITCLSFCWELNKGNIHDTYVTMYVLSPDTYCKFGVFCWGRRALFHFGSALNLFTPSAAYMRPWIGFALVQLMARRLFNTRPLSKNNAGLLSFSSIGTKFSEISTKIQIFTFTQMPFKIIVCEMAAILSRERWLNGTVSRSIDIWYPRHFKQRVYGSIIQVILEKT